MASDDDRAFADKMQALRDKYVARLDESLAAILPVVERLASGMATPEDRADLEARAHKLAGTGTSYGFPAISETAAALEDALRDHAPAARVSELAGMFVTTLCTAG